MTFSVVVADAQAVTFQWKFNGTDIPGATDSLLLTNVGPGNEGQYAVVVTNSAGSVTSAPAGLMLRRDPTVNTSTPPRLVIYSDVGGSVTVTPMKPNYNPGETVTLTATPISDSVFAGWVGDLNTIDNPATLTMNGNKTVRARFDFRSPAADCLQRPWRVCDGNTDEAELCFGRNGHLDGAPLPAKCFPTLGGDLIGTDNPATLKMDRNKTARARFASAAPIPPGLIALWRGETDASDLIGGHHGSFFAGAVATGLPSVTAAGKVGGAFNFDGTVHVRVPDTPALKPAQLTAEAWVFPTAPNGTPQTIIAHGNFGNTWDLRLTNNIPQFWSHGAQGLEGPSAIPLNEWTHLAISFDGVAKRIYVNGIEVALQGELRALVYSPSPVPVTIGSDWSQNEGSARFNGRIDEVSLYNRALTADEVLSIYNADFLGKNLSQPYFTSPSQLPDGSIGADYTQQLTTILGTPPVIFSLSEGLVPPGMTFSSAGVVSGVPSASGIFYFTARATDATGAFTEQACVLRVV